MSVRGRWLTAFFKALAVCALLFVASDALPQTPSSVSKAQDVRVLLIQGDQYFQHYYIPDARKSYKKALDAETDPVSKLQIRLRLAACDMSEGKFELALNERGAVEKSVASLRVAPSSSQDDLKRLNEVEQYISKGDDAHRDRVPTIKVVILSDEPLVEPTVKLDGKTVSRVDGNVSLSGRASYTVEAEVDTGTHQIEVSVRNRAPLLRSGTVHERQKAEFTFRFPREQASQPEVEVEVNPSTNKTKFDVRGAYQHAINIVHMKRVFLFPRIKLPDAEKDLPECRTTEDSLANEDSSAVTDTQPPDAVPGLGLECHRYYYRKFTYRWSCLERAQRQLESTKQYDWEQAYKVIAIKYSHIAEVINDHNRLCPVDLLGEPPGELPGKPWCGSCAGTGPRGASVASPFLWACTASCLFLRRRRRRRHAPSTK